MTSWDCIKNTAAVIGRKLTRMLCFFPEISLTHAHKEQTDSEYDEVIAFSDFIVVGLKPCKRSHQGNALNKAGRLVLKGSCNSRQVKVYQAANADHAAFILAASDNTEIRELFPEVLTTKGRFVLCEWVYSDTRSRPSHDDLVTVQTRLHRTSLSGFPPAGYDYWQDFIKPRFLLAAELVGEQLLAGEAIHKVDLSWFGHRQYLMHPDLTHSNMVLSQSGNWIIIDNELMSSGGLPLFDVCNTAHSMRAEEGQKFASMYFAQNKIKLEKDDLDLLSSAWLGRLAGSAFVSGNLQKVKKIFRKYKHGQHILPFRINW